MKKTATLIITHLENVYTMDTVGRQDILFHHAYIAIYHDTILAIGCGSYAHLVDKDTRFLDGRGHFAIPGFIEVAAAYPNTQRDEARIQLSYRYTHMKAGVLTMAMRETASYVEMDIVPQQPQRYPILTLETILAAKAWRKKRFCISTQDAGFLIPSPLPLAQLLYRKEKTDPYDLLKAMTRYPAASLHLTRVGRLKPGMQADLLICGGNELVSLFDGLHELPVTQIIKKGVRIYPNLLI